MPNVGVIGYGYWGPNVARNFHSSAGFKLTAVSDVSEKRLAIAQGHYPFVKGLKDPKELIRAADVDVVAIVTPVFAHYELAKEALLAGKHIFVEMPFTSTSAQARELIDLAAKKNLKIMVDHTFLNCSAQFPERLQNRLWCWQPWRLWLYSILSANACRFLSIAVFIAASTIWPGRWRLSANPYPTKSIYIA